MNKKWGISLVLIVMASICFIYKYFDKAIPLVHVPITFTSDQAQQAALEIANQEGWNLSDYSTVAYFKSDANLQSFSKSDEDLQSFVELEGGGKQAFISMITQQYYQPYQWQVRVFKEKHIKEVLLKFTPQGQKYGFAVRLPEDEPGEALSKQEALKIALDGASAWNVDLTYYNPIEYKFEIMPSGRVDHVFTYQREDISLGDGKYRITLHVAGNKFSGLDRGVKIPDEFNRRYAEMFANNHLIALVTQNFSIVFYLFIIALFALLFFYQRPRSFLIKEQLYMMALLGFFWLLSSLNQWPQVWNKYQTHMSKVVFTVQQLGLKAFGIVEFTLFVGFICLVAETMGRFVFKDHIKFFCVWSSKVACSREILKQTILGYCGAIMFLAYNVAFYLLGQYLGWWAPLSSLMDPNVLTAYIPFLTPVIAAFRAGFWEEFVCRALPLAGVLLLTGNSSHKKYWFMGMVMLQALVFGALHANYPQHPAYYRVVELFIPSCGFAALYYFFGILPCIISHFVYDAFLMLIPVFVSGLLLQKIMGICAVLIPLWVVIVAWYMNGKKLENVPISALNGSYQFQEPQLLAQPARLVGSMPSRSAYCIAFIGCVVGLGLWIGTGVVNFQSPRVAITSSKACKIAKDAITQEFGPLDDSWTITAEFMSNVSDDGNKFIWQIYGDLQYQCLMSRGYVMAPSYVVKAVKFGGPVELRAEQYEVSISGAGTVLAIEHVLPESAKGDDISRDQALSVAYQKVKEVYGLDQDDVMVIKESSIKYEGRRDWHVILRDIKAFKSSQGQARIAVTVSGDKPTAWKRFIEKTENWQREEHSRTTKHTMLSSILKAVAFGWSLLFLIFALWRYGLSSQSFVQILGITGLLVGLRVISMFNNYEKVIFGLKTTKPVWHQLVSLISSNLLVAIASGLIYAVFIYFLTIAGKRSELKASGQGILKITLSAFALGCASYGITAYFDYLAPQFEARAPYYELLNFENGTIAVMTSYLLSRVINSFIILASLFLVVDWLMAYCGRGNWLRLLLFVLAGMVIVPDACISHVGLWIVAGLVLGVMWYLFDGYYFSHDIDLLWIVLVVSCLLELAATAIYGAYPGAFVSIILAVLLSVSIAIWGLYRKL